MHPKLPETQSKIAIILHKRLKCSPPLISWWIFRLYLLLHAAQLTKNRCHMGLKVQRFPHSSLANIKEHIETVTHPLNAYKQRTDSARSEQSVSFTKWLVMAYFGCTITQHQSPAQNPNLQFESIHFCD